MIGGTAVGVIEIVRIEETDLVRQNGNPIRIIYQSRTNLRGNRCLLRLKPTQQIVNPYIKYHSPVSRCPVYDNFVAEDSYVDFHFVLRRFGVPQDSEIYISETVPLLDSAIHHSYRVGLLIAVLQIPFTMTQIDVQLDKLSQGFMTVHISTEIIMKFIPLDLIKILLEQSSTLFANSELSLPGLQLDQMLSKKSQAFESTRFAAVSSAGTLSSTSSCKAERASASTGVF